MDEEPPIPPKRSHFRGGSKSGQATNRRYPGVCSKRALSTNGSENDIRCQVTRRKDQRPGSDAARDCRDAFLGRYKTCAKLGLAFWDYRIAPHRRAQKGLAFRSAWSIVSSSDAARMMRR